MAASEQVRALAQRAAEAVNEKLGQDIVAIDMTDQMVLAEVFLIATGANERQVEAIADEVFKKLAEIGEKPIRKEGQGPVGPARLFRPRGPYPVPRAP